ncbi:DUF6427 family protein [Aquimarina acroporae]|uniref:DUF6427 family protein n=1 Tax=Aquimarina acroporae TaxID=2937283 RepID=UPI0020BDE4B5|nr:DUF6427 family protein [Aquimarina acroporae]
MLSSFFSKSKPINYIVVALYMLILFCIAQYKKGVIEESRDIILIILSGILYILPMLLLNYVVQRNDLTEKGTYTILLYAFLTALLPGSLVNIHILIASAFVLLGLYNILRLKDEKQIKAKIFNASLCIGVATIAYFWSLGFIVFVYLGVLYFEPKNYRNWIIPILGVLTVYLFANCFTLFFYDSFFAVGAFINTISLSFAGYLVKDHLFSVGILAICILFFLSVYLIKYGKRTANIKPILRLIIAYLIIAMALVVVIPYKNTSELFFIAAPLSIMGTSYLEMNYNMLAKEINIWVFVLIPFTMLLF